MLLAWQRFDKQAPALEACAAKRHEADTDTLSVHRRTEPWMVTAMDTDAKGNKAYAVTTPQAAFLVCMERDPYKRVNDVAPRSGIRVGRHQYEVLMPDEQLLLYCDAEFDVALNPTLDGDACVRILMIYMARAYEEIPDRPQPTLPREAMVIETSHRPGAKMSYHIKVRPAWGVAANMTAQRLYWGRVAAMIEKDTDLGDTDAASLTVKVSKKIPRGERIVVEASFHDMHVYTTYRLMRFLGACKWPREGAEPSHLVPLGKTRADISYEQWRASLVSVCLRPAEEPTPPVLNMPHAWQTHVSTYWKSPIATARPVKPKDSTDAAVKNEQESIAPDHAALIRYRSVHWPLDYLVALSAFGGSVPLGDRELSFEDAKGVFMRHATYNSEAELRSLLVKNRISAVHLGAAATHGIVAGTELCRYASRELVFDIDASDYDNASCMPVRSCACAKSKNVCYECWFYIEFAAAVVQDALRMRMGIPEERIMWVWSGGRGIHVWINALSVITMSRTERESLCQRFFEPPSLELPLAPEVERIFARVIVPHLERSLPVRPGFLTRSRLLEWAHWLDIAEEGSATRKTVLPVVNSLSDHCDVGFAVRLRTVASSVETLSSTQLWKRVTVAYADSRRAPGAPHVHSLYWILAQYAWPRIDAPVTFGKRKTLRTPFSLNTRTQKVALPICAPCSPEHTEAYWRAVSTVGMAVEQLHETEALEDGKARMRSWLSFYTNEVS